MADQIVFSQEQTNGHGPNDAQLASEFEGGIKGQQQQQPNPQQTPDRPEWLPENFKSVEDYTKAYDEQRSTLTQLQQELAELKKGNSKDTKGDDPKAKGGDGEGEADEFDPRSVTEDALMDYTKELNETGEISQESREKILEMFAVPEFVLDTYIEGVKALNQNIGSTIDNAFGGVDQRDAMLAWAGDTMDDAEITRLESQLNSTDINTVLFAADALKTKYEAANGSPPSKVLGGSGQSVSTSAFQSWEQVTAAMGDPKYHSDPAYRSEVMRKLAAFNG